MEYIELSALGSVDDPTLKVELVDNVETPVGALEPIRDLKLLCPLLVCSSNVISEEVVLLHKEFARLKEPSGGSDNEEPSKLVNVSLNVISLFDEWLSLREPDCISNEISELSEEVSDSLVNTLALDVEGVAKLDVRLMNELKLDTDDEILLSELEDISEEVLEL